MFFKKVSALFLTHLKTGFSSLEGEILEGYNACKTAKKTLDYSGFKSPKNVSGADFHDWLEINYTSGVVLYGNTARSNYLNGKYIQSDANHTWCVVTSTRDNVHVTIILDVSSGFVIQAWVQLEPLTAQAFILCLDKSFTEHGKPKTIHSD